MARAEVARIRRRAVGSTARLAPDLHPVLRRVYANRGVADSRALNLDLGQLLPGSGLAGLREAAGRLAAAVMAQSRILIAGDFDADGATGTALAVAGLRALGAKQVDFLVPDRFRLGYGLSPELANLAIARNPQLLITVDNGISSLAGVAALRAAGVAVIVTDHHLPGDQLPAADAIVNPNQPGDRFASKALAGVGVMFYLLAATRSALRARGWFADRAPPNLADFLDLVALGTVADMVPLDRNNRILVEQGLRRIRAGRARPGIAALISVSGRDPARIGASDLGFALGPRLNAAGRLEHMEQGIHCLLAADVDVAMPLATELDRINRQRRELQTQMQDEAVSGLLEELSEQQHGLVLFQPHWHEGIVGLVASRVKERFHRPTIAFAPSGQGGLKGSGRSIAGFHLRDALALLVAENPGLVEKFGGHAMAVGLSLPTDHLAEFTSVFDAIAERLLAGYELDSVVLSDGSLAPAELSLNTAQALWSGGPWGQGFPEPCFDDRFRIVSQRIVGQGHLKLQLACPGADAVYDAMAFGREQRLAGDCAQLAYRLVMDEFRGRERLQLMIEAIAE